VNSDQAESIAVWVLITDSAEFVKTQLDLRAFLGQFAVSNVVSNRRYVPHAFWRSSNAKDAFVLKPQV
jgi:hypothetical protein